MKFFNVKNGILGLALVVGAISSFAASAERALGYRVQMSTGTGDKVEAKAFSPAIYYSVSGFTKPTASVVTGSFLIDSSGQLTWTAGFDGATNLMSGKCSGIQYTQDHQFGQTTGITGPCGNGTIDPATGTMQFTFGGPGYDIQAKGSFSSWFGPVGTLTVTPKAGYSALGVWDNTTPVGILFQDSTGSFFGSAGRYQSMSGMIDSQGRGVLNFGDGRYAALTTSAGQSFGIANFAGDSYSIAGTLGNFFAVNQNRQIVATGSIITVTANDPAWSNLLTSQGSPVPSGFNAILQANGMFFAGYMGSTFGQFSSSNGGLIAITFGR